MSSEKHPNLQLHKWQATDGVLRAEFNENFAKLDLGIGDIYSLIYTPPVVTLSLNPSTATKEYGDPIDSVILTGNVTRKTQDVTTVEFYRDSTLLNTISNPSASGGSFSYTENTDVADTVTFKVKAYDAKGSAEATKTISYVYPFYVGSVTVATPNESQIEALTKLVKTKSNTTQAFTTTDGRFAIAYPQSYGALTSILDQNNFETIGLYNLTVINVTGLNGTSVPYNVYVLNNPTTQTNFTNTFKF